MAQRLRGKGHTLQVAREIAWRRAAYRWRAIYQHCPAELNDVADALSRLEAVPPRGIPKLLRDVPRTEVMPLEELWQAWVSEWSRSGSV